MASKETPAYNLSANCRNILNNAEHLAVEKKSPFVGTEHILKCLLNTENRIVPWMMNKPVSLDKSQVKKKVEEMLQLTKSAGSPNFYSPSLERSLVIAGAIWSGHPLPTEGLVIGALLAHKDVKNAMGSILSNVAGDRNILELLLNDLSFF